MFQAATPVPWWVWIRAACTIMRSRDQGHNWKPIWGTQFVDVPDPLNVVSCSVKFNSRGYPTDESNFTILEIRCTIGTWKSPNSSPQIIALAISITSPFVHVSPMPRGVNYWLWSSSSGGVRSLRILNGPQKGRTWRSTRRARPFCS